MNIDNLPRDIFQEISKYADTTLLHRTSKTLRNAESEYIRSSNLEKRSRNVYAVGFTSQALVIYTVLNIIRDGAYGKLVTMLRFRNKYSEKMTRKSITVIMCCITFMEYEDFERLYRECLSVNTLIRWDIIAKWCVSVQGVDRRILRMMIDKGKLYSRLMSGEVNKDETWEACCDWYDEKHGEHTLEDFLNMNLSLAVEMLRNVLEKKQFDVDDEVVDIVRPILEEYNSELMYGLRHVKTAEAMNREDAAHNVIVMIYSMYRLPELLKTYLASKANTTDVSLNYKTLKDMKYESFVSTLIEVCGENGAVLVHNAMVQLNLPVVAVGNNLAFLIHRNNPRWSNEITIWYSLEVILQMSAFHLHAVITFADLKLMSQIYGRKYAKDRVKQLMDGKRGSVSLRFGRELEACGSVFGHASSELNIRVLVLGLEMLATADQDITGIITRLLQNVIKGANIVDSAKIEIFMSEVNKYLTAYWNGIMREIRLFETDNARAIKQRREKEDMEREKQLELRKIEDAMNSGVWIRKLEALTRSQETIDSSYRFRNV